VFSGRQSLEPVSEIRWEVPRNPLPAFTLTDLGGKTWKLTDLNGKATLINVWATWCGPCRAEHPEFQKLYEKVKDRGDITVLSLNVDEEGGLVAPYMTDNHYTFPVMLGKDMLRAVSGEDGVKLLKRPNLSGGSHDNDWRCPSCHHFNSEKRRACAKCNNVAPANGRITRRALRAREKEHRTQGYLRKVGLLAPDSAPSPVGSQQ
jgi:thiol-disulfide isomerase/thioredoxin